MTDPEVSNALCGLGIALAVVVVSLAVMAFRRTRRNHWVDPPRPDPRSSIAMYNKIIGK